MPERNCGVASCWLNLFMDILYEESCGTLRIQRHVNKPRSGRWNCRRDQPVLSTYKTAKRERFILLHGRMEVSFIRLIPANFPKIVNAAAQSEVTKRR